MPQFSFEIKKQLLRFTEVEEILGCSNSKVYSLLEEGLLIAHRANRDSSRGGPGIRIVAQSVCDYLNNGIIPPSVWAEKIDN